MFKVFKEEFKHMFMSVWRIISYIVLLLIPVIYSTIVVSSFFKPFHHVDNLKVVVVNLDKEAKPLLGQPSSHAKELSSILTNTKEIKLGSKTLKVNIEDASNIYKTRTEAKAAVHNGDVAAVIMIPKGYSDSFASMVVPLLTASLTNDPKKIADVISKKIKQVEFHISFKHNFIRGEMTNLASAIQKFSHDVLAPGRIGNTIFNALSHSFTTSTVEQHILGKNINTYGKGFAPFFISISLWAGALAGTFIIKNKRYGEKEKTIQTFFGKTMVWQLTSFIQSSLLTLGLAILGVTPAGGWGDLWQWWLFIVFMSATFSLTIQGIGSIFRYADIGKFICVVLLILNLVASSGSFPSFMQPAFFTFITDLLPFHYGIEGMRQILWEPSTAEVFKNMAFLLLFPLITVSIALTVNIIWDKKTLKITGQYDSYEISTLDL